MGIPDYQSIMLPLLKFLADFREYSFRETVEGLAREFKLTDEERKLLGIEKLPESLKDSLDAFEYDELTKKIFGKEFKELYLEVKRKEVQEFEKAKNNGKEREWEINKYLFC